MEEARFPAERSVGFRKAKDLTSRDQAPGTCTGVVLEATAVKSVPQELWSSRERWRQTIRNKQIHDNIGPVQQVVWAPWGRIRQGETWTEAWEWQRWGRGKLLFGLETPL